jgi:hypothetical protein
MHKNILLLIAAAGLAFILSACVTINIYFPAAAAEKAADKIIEEVWQLKDAQTKPGEPTPTPAPDAKPADVKPDAVPAK